MAGVSIGNRFSTGSKLSVGQGFSQGSGLYFNRLSVPPALNLVFAGATTLDSRITYSRPSLATMYDSTGKLTFCPNNLITYSDTPSNAAWGKVSTTVLGNDVTITGAPGAFQHVYVNMPSTPLGGDAYIWAVQLSGSGTITLDANGFTGSQVCALSATPTWFYARITFNTGSPNPRVISNPSNTATSFTLHNATLSRVTYETAPRTQDRVTTTSSAYYGPRFDYNPATLVARGLLIEEARTNLFTYSQDFANAAWTKAASTVTAGSIIGPDGTSSGTRVQATAGSNLFNLFGSGTLTTTNTVVYTQSCFVKYGNAQWLWVRVGNPDASWAAFDLLNGVVGNKLDAANAISSYAITPIGNGWLRVTMTWTANATSAYNMVWTIGTGSTPTGGGVSQTGAEFFYLFGAQYEAGAFATSYIPTGASSVARSADSVSMTGTNFSSWYSQSEGTFVINYTRVSGTSIILQAANAGGSNYHNFYSYSLFTVCETVNTTQQGLTQLTTSVSGVPQDVAYGYKANDFAGCVDGTSPVLDPAGTVPSDLNRLSLGLAIVGSWSLNGWLASLTYYNTRLPNATLQSLTT